MNKILLDSSFVVALFKNQDIDHQKALDLAKYLINISNEFIVTDLVLAEVITVISQRVDKKLASMLQKIILNNPKYKLIVMDENLIRKAAKIFDESQSKNISFTDCTTLAVIDHYAIDYLVSFDIADFKKYERKYQFKLINGI